MLVEALVRVDLELEVQQIVRVGELRLTGLGKLKLIQVLDSSGRHRDPRIRLSIVYQFQLTPR